MSFNKRKIKKYFSKFGSLEASFSLIELLVVISMMSLLSSVVMAATVSARDKAIIAAGQLFESNVYAKIGDGLVAQYTFDEPVGNMVYDSSGSGIDLIGKSTVRRTKGVNGNALEIQGDNDYVWSKIDATTNNLTKFNSVFDYTQGSISMWLKPYNFNQTGSPSQSPIMTIENSTIDLENNRRMWISYGMERMGNSFPGIYADANGGWNWNTGSWDTGIVSQSLTGRWNHVLITWRTAGTPSISIYLNGKFINTTNVDPSKLPFFGIPWGAEADTLMIGGDNKVDRFTRMDMDRVRIYNKSFDLQ